MLAKKALRNVGATITYLSGALFVLGLVFQGMCNPIFGLLSLDENQKRVLEFQTSPLKGFLEASVAAGVVPEKTIPKQGLLHLYSVETCLQVAAITGILFAVFVIVGTLSAPLRLEFANYGEGLRYAVTATRGEPGVQPKTPLMVLAQVARVFAAIGRGLAKAGVAIARLGVKIAPRIPGAVAWAATRLPVHVVRVALIAVIALGRGVVTVVRLAVEKLPGLVARIPGTLGKAGLGILRAVVRLGKAFPDFCAKQWFAAVPFGVFFVLQGVVVLTLTREHYSEPLISKHEVPLPYLAIALGVFMMFAWVKNIRPTDRSVQALSH